MGVLGDLEGGFFFRRWLWRQHLRNSWYHSLN